MSHDPPLLLHNQIALLSDRLPPVLNGDAAGIHDARIATRRIREVLPLTVEWRRRDATDDLYRRFRRVGRALGGVRDADVRLLLLKRLESRIPGSAPSLIVVRQRQEAARLRLMRNLIKQLEREELPHLLRDAATMKRTGSGWWHRSPRDWRRLLDARVVERSAQVGQTVRHATGVYFPKRAHGARIAVKKLRYALEIGAAVGWQVADSIRTLKKAQDILGDLHDRQELLNELGETTDDADSRPAEQIAVVTQVVDAEIRDLHARYLARRGRILEIADAPSAMDTGRMRTAPLIVAASAIAASSGLLAAGRRRRAPQ